MGEGSALAQAAPLTAESAALAEPLWNDALALFASLRGGSSLLRWLPNGSSGTPSFAAASVEGAGQLFLGTYDDVACGLAYAALPTATHRATLLLLFVEEGFRTVGVGEVLLEAVERWAGEAGLGPVDVVLPPGAREAKVLLEGRGYLTDLLLVHREGPGR
jgi:GNAT superfamily N-acetyltransferase